MKLETPAAIMVRRFAAFCTVLVLVGLLAGAGAVFADGPKSPPSQSGPPGKSDSKISPLLFGVTSDAHTQPRTDRVTRSAAGAQRAQRSQAGELTIDPEVTLPDPRVDEVLIPQPLPAVRVDDQGNVQVYIYTYATDDLSLSRLHNRGVRTELVSSDEGIVQGWVPVDNLTAVADLKFVTRITPPDYAVTKTDGVNSEGDLIHRAHVVRGLSGFTGAGVTVGVISNGVDSRSSAQATGDLPAQFEIDPDLPGEGDEGTALLEIVHDLAPDARLAFAGPSTSLEMIEAIEFLAYEAFGGAGVDIIVDDLGFFGEPMFADGPVAEAAQQATDDGAVFLSAAGNSARDHYVGTYDDGTDGYHEFAAGDTALSIVARSGARVFLQWSDPFGASSNDFDLYVCLQGYVYTDFNLQNGNCWASGGPQDGDDDPFEGLAIGHPSTALFDVFIHAYDLQVPNPAPQLKLYVLGGQALEHGSASGGIFGHAAASGVLAVGAIPADDPGNNDIEPFSDQGPVEIYHPARETRQKPDITAIDGVAITGAGGFSNPFFGTSAASPHAAGIAALVMQAERKANPGGSKAYIANQVFNTLRDTAVDLGAAGIDNVYGYGRVDALAAIASTGRLSAETYVVDSTGDGADAHTSDGVCEDASGDCTLRAAIEQANAFGGGIIEFNISGVAPHTIQPASALPTITQRVVVDGTSQPAGSSTAKVQIELDGTSAGTDTDGLAISASGGEVRGLAINRFGGDGISLTSGGSVSIVGNLIGTDATGAADQGNGGVGLSIASPNNRVWENVISGNESHGVSISGSGADNNYVADNFIGSDLDGDADLGNTGAGVFISSASDAKLLDNLISGNDSYGVRITGSGADGNRLEGNLIGTQADGATALANGSHGVAIAGGASDNAVETNTIAHNGGDGVSIIGNATTGNTVWENGIHSNTGLGIDLSPNGVTANDSLDADTGPHGLQNFPVLSSAGILGDEVQIFGSLNGAALTEFIVDFYTSDACDGSGNGEGQAWLGFSRVATDAPAPQPWVAPLGLARCWAAFLVHKPRWEATSPPRPPGPTGPLNFPHAWKRLTFPTWNCRHPASVLTKPAATTPASSRWR